MWLGTYATGTQASWMLLGTSSLQLSIRRWQKEFADYQLSADVTSNKQRQWVFILKRLSVCINMRHNVNNTSIHYCHLPYNIDYLRFNLLIVLFEWKLELCSAILKWTFSAHAFVDVIFTPCYNSVQYAWI